MATRTRIDEYEQVLDDRTYMRVRMTMHDNALVNYAVILVHQPVGQAPLAVRIYDYAHGVHDEHRCDRAGVSMPARKFHHGGVREGFDHARRLIRAEYVTMISTWLDQPPT